MSFKDLQKKYSSQTKVIILQHTFGITPTERNSIIEFAKSHKLYIIEDVAHGFNPLLFRSKRFSSAVLMSFGRSKFRSSLFGGGIAVRGIRAGDTMRSVEKNIPNTSPWLLLQIVWYKIFAFFIKSTYDIFLGKAVHFLFKQFNLITPEITKKEKKGEFNYTFLRTFPNIAAIFLLKQLDTFNDVMDTRKRVSEYYDSQFKTHIAHGLGLLRYPYLCDNPNQLQKVANKQKIQIGRWYSQVVAPKELDLFAVGYPKGSCPIAEKVSNRVVNLPTNISMPDAKRIVTLINTL